MSLSSELTRTYQRAACHTSRNAYRGDLCFRCYKYWLQQKPRNPIKVKICHCGKMAYVDDLCEECYDKWKHDFHKRKQESKERKM